MQKDASGKYMVCRLPKWTHKPFYRNRQQALLINAIVTTLLQVADQRKNGCFSCWRQRIPKRVVYIFQTLYDFKTAVLDNPQLPPKLTSQCRSNRARQ